MRFIEWDYLFYFNRSTTLLKILHIFLSWVNICWCMQEKSIQVLNLLKLCKKMTINISIRKLISSWLKSGYDAPTIYTMLNNTVSRATVYRWVNRISKSGIMAATSPGRPRSVRTKGFIAKVKRNVSKNQKRKSARQIAREEGCDQRTVRVAIRQDLSFKA